MNRPGLLAIAPLLLERLAHDCPSAQGNVFATADLPGVTEQSQVTPALHVVLLDYAPVESVGTETRWEELWCVVAVVKHSARKNRSAAQQEAAESLLAEVLKSLSGVWIDLPLGGRERLQVTPGPAPHFTETHGYFPLAFKVLVTTP
ncbi:MAG: hypothetical protein LBS89_02880 [Zoogloeaceae bacterium]|jgi:hypothetical protein|nr:hypothetical protein [Zoogloeaceae bacterium]